MHWHAPYGADGFQLCMALYGACYAIRLLRPEWAGMGESLQLFGPLGFWVGAIVLVHSLVSIGMIMAPPRRNYWRALLACIGALVWIWTGLAQGSLEIVLAHHLPTWGLFETLGGIGLAVTTTQRAGDPVPPLLLW